MISLYVREQGAVVRRTGQRLVVEKDGAALQSVRLRDLERVALFGHAEITHPALRLLLENGIETVLLTMGGRYLGRLAPAEGKNVFLRREQFRRHEDSAFRLGVARAVVAGKLRNARTLLLRHRRNHPGAEAHRAIAGLERRIEDAADAPGIPALLGIEGDGSRVYFAAFGGMVRREFSFTTRSRRPPRDPVNALLSFGYTLLTTELSGAAAAQGLDPGEGFLHELDYGRPSMALDLLEEFRQPVSDRLALSLVNRGVLREEHFERRDDGGVLLNDPGRALYLDAYHRTLETEFAERDGTRVTFRQLFLRQAGRLRAAIEGTTTYEPYRHR